MNYNDIKNLNISKRGKKELLNALNKGGGSGAGVTIVDSVDKLDENAPVGSMAVVAEQSDVKICKVNELYQMDMENDLLIDQENYTIEILYPEKFSKIIDFDFHIPNNNGLIHSSEQSMFLIGPFSLFNSMVGGSEDLNNVVGIMLESTVKDNIVQEITGACINKGVQEGFVLIHNDGEKYIKDENAISEFKSAVSSIGVEMYYLCDMFHLMGMATGIPSYINDFITFYSGDSVNSRVYIKDHSWKELHKSYFSNLENKIKSKQDVIHTVRKSDSQSYYEIQYGCYNSIIINNIINDVTMKLLEHPGTGITSDYKEYLITIRNLADPLNIRFVDKNDKEITIKWANQIAFTPEPGYNYVISIVDCLGVFLKF